MSETFDEVANALLALEEKTASKAAQAFNAALRSVLADLKAKWPGDDATDEAKQYALSKINLEPLVAPLPKAQEAIIIGAVQALDLGVNSGLAQAKAAGIALTDTFKRILPPDVLAVIKGLERSSQAALVQARGVLREATSLEQALVAVAIASPHTRAERAARTATNLASNKGLNAVTDAHTDLVAIWVAERDACVHCLAYQGHKRVEGGYPAGLTFGKKPLRTDRVPEPPLHPFCRCTQMLVHKDEAVAIQAGLQREAKRSILRGFSLESESGAVRIDAARRLLAKNPTMPKSVKAYARSAIAKGAFARGRKFPGAR